MQQNIVRLNIKRFACLLAIVILAPCCPASAKTVQIRGAPGSVEAGSVMLLDGFNFPELFYQIKDNRTYEWLNISYAANTTIDKGGTFEYKTDIANTNDITIFKCKVDAILRGTDSNIVLLKSVKHYSDTPLVLNTGDKFGDFEIISITNDTIEMKNSKTISCSLDETVDLLDDWLDLKVSEKGYWGYVYTTKTLECAEPVTVSSIARSADTSSSEQNTTASNTSDNTGTNSTNSTVTAVLPATPAPGTTSAVTAETEQPKMLAAAEGAGIAPHALPAPGAVSLVGLFVILVLMMNIRKNKK